MRPAARVLEGALLLDPSRPSLRSGFAELLYQRALLSERDHRPEQKDELLERLRSHDTTGVLRRRWEAPASLSARHLTRGRGGQGFALRSRRSGPHRARARPGDRASRGHPSTRLLSLRARASRPAIAAPFHAAATGGGPRVGARAAGARARGYVVHPAGTVSLRQQRRRGGTQGAPPGPTAARGPDGRLRHRTHRGDLRPVAGVPREPPACRAGRASSASGFGSRCGGAAGDTRRRLAARVARAAPRRDGELLAYPERTRLSHQDWREFPVSAISWGDAQAFLAWLDGTRRLPGARLCTEHEWERAARGADGRRYPHGATLAPDEANHDETYGRKPLAFGPDAVGSHPASHSPFGLADMAGNVWEWVQSVHGADEVVYRGGGWYEGRTNARSNNRQVGETAMRDPVIGLRVCASFDASAPLSRTSSP